MSNSPSGFGEKFNFRGAISFESDFYMMAVLRKNNVEPMINANPNNFKYLGKGSEKYFFLCHNQYKKDGQDVNRLYWSSDPDDFQKNTSTGYMNEGVARMNLVKNGANPTLRYRSSMAGENTKTENTRYNFMGYDMENLLLDTNGLPVIINSYDKGTSTYALDSSSFYYSVPYNIKSASSVYSTNDATTYNSIPWIFRKFTDANEIATDGGVSGLTIGKPTSGGAPLPSNPENIFNFVNIQNLDTFNGTAGSKFNYGSVKYYRANTTIGKDYTETDIGFSIHGNHMVNDYFPKINGIVNLKNSTNESAAIKYSTAIMSGETDKGSCFQFNLTDTTKGMVGDIDFQATKGDGFSMYFNERNHPDCFAPISDETTFSKWFDIYFLPVEENAYFPGGVHINDITYFPTSCPKNNDGLNAITPVYTAVSGGGKGLKFFSSDSTKPYRVTAGGVGSIGFYHDFPNVYYKCDIDAPEKDYNLEKEKKYRKIYNLILFQNTDSLNQTYWSETAIESGFDNIAKFTQPLLTFYGWATYAEARSAFVFDYCTNSETCGYCYGKNKQGKSICFADKLTREYASQTTKGTVNLPLTGHERATGTHSRPGKHLQTYVIVIICVLVVLLFIVVGSLMYVRRKRFLRGDVY